MYGPSKGLTYFNVEEALDRESVGCSIGDAWMTRTESEDSSKPLACGWLSGPTPLARALCPVPCGAGSPRFPVCPDQALTLWSPAQGLEAWRRGGAATWRRVSVLCFSLKFSSHALEKQQGSDYALKSIETMFFKRVETVFFKSIVAIRPVLMVESILCFSKANCWPRSEQHTAVQTRQSNSL